MKKLNNGAGNKKNYTEHNNIQNENTGTDFESCALGGASLGSAVALEENQLLARIAQGDHAALAIIYHRYVDKVSAYAYRILHPYGLTLVTDEVTQDAFRKLQRNAGDLKVTSTILPWLKTVAKNNALDKIRPVLKLLEKFPARKSIDEESVSDTVHDSHSKSPREIAIIREELARVLQLIKQLPDNIRGIFEDFVFNCLSVEQIANKYSKSIGTVTWSIYHARELIKEQIQE